MDENRTIDLSRQMIGLLKRNGPSTLWQLSRKLHISMSMANGVLMYLTERDVKLAETDEGKLIYMEGE